MARIRSVHPGLFTDEAFMSASPLARLLMIGLWTEAWDDGVFEWKPIVIKARLFPADACDVVALLDELSALHVIKRVERSGKAWGLIRNFRKFQRPKKPNSSGIAIADDVEFLGPEHVSSEPVPNQFRTSSEILPQMEDGGWRMEEKKKEKPSVLEREDKPAPKPRKPSSDDKVFDILTNALSDANARAIIEHRRAKGAKLTERAAELLVKEFFKVHNPDDAAETMIAQGWQGFNVEWYRRARPTGKVIEAGIN
jgi:hypothetical protein